MGLRNTRKILSPEAKDRANIRTRLKYGWDVGLGIKTTMIGMLRALMDKVGSMKGRWSM